MADQAAGDFAQFGDEKRTPGDWCPCYLIYKGTGQYLTPLAIVFNAIVIKGIRMSLP